MIRTIPAALTMCSIVSVAGCVVCPCPAPGDAALPETRQTGERPLDEIRAILNETLGDQVARIPRGRYVGASGLKVSDRSGLTIECEPGTEILIRDTDSHVLLIEHSQDITVRGGLWRHVEPLAEYICHGPVVSVHDSERIRIEDAVLDGCGAIGVSAGHSSGITVERCLVTNNSFTAFYLETCDGFSIFDSIVRDNGNTISAYRTSGLELSGNTIEDNGGHFREPASPGPSGGGSRVQP